MGTFFSAARSADTDTRGSPTLKRQRKSETGVSTDDVAAHPPAKRSRSAFYSASAVECAENNGHPSDSSKKAVGVRRRKRKVALMLGYIGENYFGMQLNVGVLTIERVLLDALNEAGAILNENKDSLGKINWMRAARTDKGVSAASQCVSAKIQCEVRGEIDPRLIAAIRDHLPDDVHLYGILRATNGFNARSDCHRRRYEYILPLRVLGGGNAIECAPDGAPGDPRVSKLNKILQSYVGTHCFANFTERLTGSDDAAKRYMIEVKCSEPFLPAGSGVYYVAICIYGQSFVLHQIRKMVGLALFVYLGRVAAHVIPVALSPHVRIPTPTAPSLGLLLDELYFDQYNTRHKSALRLPISMKGFAEEKMKFKLDVLYARIAEKERLNRTMENWIRSSVHRQKYDAEEMEKLHQDFVLSDLGLEEERQARIASLYPIVTNMESFIRSRSSAANADALQLAKTLKSEFEKRFGVPASFMARAPGRVVLIGDHLDYNDLPVIGMALSQSTFIAGCLDDTSATLDVQHLKSDVYKDASLHSDGVCLAESKSNSEVGNDLDEKWLRYVSCGIKAMVASLKLNKRREPGGGKLLIDGNLPRGVGLGSSSSLVTAAALSASRLNRKRLPRHRVTEVAAEGEMLGAGTQGGALDHAVCMGGVEDCAVLVSFNPRPKTVPLQMPEDVVFVVVNSNSIAEKGALGNANLNYNTRVAECRVASAILARRLGTISVNMVQTVGQLLQMAMQTKHLNIKSMRDLREKAAVVMPVEEGMSLKQVLEEMKISEIEVRSRFLRHLPLTNFAVGKRMAHVFSEAERVERVKSLLESTTARDGLIEEIGGILDESHSSLKIFYECSSNCVDSLVSFCKANGASGSRITGAGWGGCVLSVLRKSESEHFVDAAGTAYGKNSVFVVSPASGASVFAVHASYNKPRST